MSTPPFVSPEPSEHMAYRPPFQEEDICPSCTLFPYRIVNWPCDVEQEREKNRALRIILSQAPEVTIIRAAGKPDQCIVKRNGVEVFHGFSVSAFMAL